MTSYLCRFFCLRLFSLTVLIRTLILFGIFFVDDLLHCHGHRFSELRGSRGRSRFRAVLSESGSIKGTIHRWCLWVWMVSHRTKTRVVRFRTTHTTLALLLLEAFHPTVRSFPTHKTWTRTLPNFQLSSTASNNPRVQHRNPFLFPSTARDIRRYLRFFFFIRSFSYDLSLSQLGMAVYWFQGAFCP